MPKPMLLYSKNHDFRAVQKGKKWVIFININVMVCLSIQYKFAKYSRISAPNINLMISIASIRYYHPLF